MEHSDHLTYQLPHEDILRLADVQLPPIFALDDAGKIAVLFYRDQYVSIEELCIDELKLAGLRLDPNRFIGSRIQYATNMSIYDLDSGTEKMISGLPVNPKLTNFAWSPDQEKMAFTHTAPTGVELWIAHISDAKANKLSAANLNASIGSPFIWDRNSYGLLVKQIPDDQADLIETGIVIPDGPNIGVSNEGEKAENRTYQDLLKNKSDAHNFEVMIAAEIYYISLAGSSSKWKDSGMYRGMVYSPNGQYVLINELHRPFSYIVPMSRFPFTMTIYSSEGKSVRQILNAPLEEVRAKGFMSTRAGIRQVRWRSDKPATIAYTYALDGGNSDKAVELRDELFCWPAPFDKDPKSLLKTKDRLYGVSWGNEQVAIAQDYWWDTRKTRSYLFAPDDPQFQPRIFHERDFQDRYNDPGSFMTERNEYGRYVLVYRNGKIFLTGDGHSTNGIHPFVDEFDLNTLESKRLWQAQQSDLLESVIDLLDPDKGIILERIESKSMYPNYYVRNIRQGGAPKQVTFFENPFEALQDVHKEVITYKRNDGVDLSATLYLPPGYDRERKEKLPLLMWAYPEEFKDKSSAGQVTKSANEFTFPWYGSPLYWVMRGMIVLDDVSFPILGESEEEPNDTFLEQLVDSARSAIDYLDEQGYINRDRVAIGGHSYGAFMTANLLTHSNLFAAGIARSGAYNRTLTPFGFQSEQRNYWEAPEVYHQMSPFSHADKMKTPLLLIHGEDDNNSGTYTMQSERYFNALKGLGAPVRLVILPKESHSYAARESILHMLWEQDEWLQKHLVQ